MMKTLLVKKTILYPILLLGLSFILGVPQTDAAEMQRLYNPNTGHHFYTESTKERNHLVNVGWQYEGVAWQTPDSGLPVYRLYQKQTGNHLYTMNKNEANALRQKGWTYEGVSWYSDENKEVPLYRTYNPNALTGAHHYTKDKDEQRSLIRAGWRDEGVAWYGIVGEPPVNADKSTLTRLIASAKTKRQSAYTTTSWANFQEELNDALYVKASKYSTQTEINRAVQELKEDLNKLAIKPIPQLSKQSYIDTLNHYLFDLINQYRAYHGLNKLVWDSTAARGSAIRAKEATTTWSHTRPDGSAWNTAIPSNDSKYRSTGEALGQIYYSSKLTKEEAYTNAKRQLENWKNSPPHNAILLHSLNKQQWASVGTAYGSNGYLVCQFLIEY